MILDGGTIIRRVAVCGLLAAWIGCAMLSGQTAVDLRTQSKNVDFSTAQSTRPSKTGTALPSTCSPGETFFKTNAAAGQNWYGCTETNTWSLQGRGDGATMFTELLDFSVVRTSGVTLTIGSTCSPLTPCNVRVGSTVYTYTTSATATIGGGTGTAYIYIDSAGSLTVGHNLTLGCSAGCVAQSGVTAFPPDSLPLYTWTASAGTWNTTGVDRRALLEQKRLQGGGGLVVVNSGDSTEVSVDSAVVATQGGANLFTGANSFGGAQSTIPAKTGTALPGTCTVGEVVFLTTAAAGRNLYFCTANGVWTQMSDGVAPDRSVASVTDEFCSHVGWTLNSEATGSYAGPSEAGHPCILQLTSSATVNPASMYRGQTPPEGMVVDAGAGTWELHWIIRRTTADNDTEMRVGLSANPDAAGGAADRVGMRLATGTDTNWTFESCAGGNCSTAVSAVAADNGWVHFRMRGDNSGQIYFCLNGCLSEQALNTNVPAGALNPYLAVGSASGTESRTVLVDWFAWQQRGVAR